MERNRTKYEIKSLEDFITLVENNEIYTGLVESLGYVYWTTHTLYFEQINSNEKWVTPIYQQTFLPAIAERRGNPIVTRITYSLHVMARDDLQKKNPGMYAAYYLREDEDEAIRPVADALRVNRPVEYPMMNAGGDYRSTNPLFKLGSDVNDAIGTPLEIAGLLTDNAAIGKGAGILSILSMAHAMEKGEYWSAGGDILLFVVGEVSKKANPYVAAISIFKDLLQSKAAIEGRARQYALEHKHLQTEWYKTYQNDPYDPKLDKLKKRIEYQREAFEDEINGLKTKKSYYVK